MLYIALLWFGFTATGFASPQYLSRPDGSLITYYLDIQQTTSSNTAATQLLLLIQGSSCNSVRRSDRINQRFARLIEEADVLTVEKYGIDAALSWSNNAEREDCPQEYLKHDRPKQRLADYQQVLNAVTAQKAYRQIVVLGGSEGALIANMLAAHAGQVDFAVSINGGGRWFLDDVLHSIEAQSDNEAAMQAAVNGFRGFSQHILNSAPSVINVSGHGYRWWRQMLEIDQRALLKQARVPVLVVQAGRDRAVAADKAKQMLEALIPVQSNLSFYHYPALDHQLLSEDGISEEAKVIADIQYWLTAQGVLTPGIVNQDD